MAKETDQEIHDRLQRERAEARKSGDTYAVKETDRRIDEATAERIRRESGR